MGAAAAPISLAATGLSMLGKIDAGDTAAQNAMGQAQNALDTASQTAAYDRFKAHALSDSAAYGRVSAAQTDTSARMQIQDRLATIMAVRAASGAEAGSPTTAALLDRSQQVGDMDRSQKVQNIMAQVSQDLLGSGYYKQAGWQAIQIGNTQAAQWQANASASETSGWLGALAGGLTGLAGAAGNKDFTKALGF